MALTRLSRKPSVKLHRTTEAPFMANGWEITTFYDENDDLYLRAQRKRDGRVETKWQRIEE